MLAVTPLSWPYWVQMLCARLFVSIVNMDRRALAAPFLALYFTASLLLRSFDSMWLPIGWMALGSGFVIAGWSIKPRAAFWGLVLLLVFHALAIPGSLLWGNDNWELTMGALLWMTPNILLFASRATLSVFAWLMPAVFVHAGLILWHGLTAWTWVDGVLVRQGAHTGLSHNKNLAAGFLAIGIIYLMTTRFRWLSLPLVVALLFTGSRWGLLVTVMVLIAMMVTKRVSWRPLMGVVVVVTATVLLLGWLTPSPYAIVGYDSFASAAYSARDNIQGRIAVPHIPSLLPRGVAEHPGLHNVPLRLAVENGVQAAMVWVGITVWALTRRRLSTEWWLLLTVVMLGLLDYYTFQGGHLPYWWMLIGLVAGASARGAVRFEGGVDLDTGR